VKQLLKSHKVTAAVVTPFRRWCAGLIDRLEGGGTADGGCSADGDGAAAPLVPDVVFMVGTEGDPGHRRVRAHRVVLGCRCAYFREAFEHGGRWHDALARGGEVLVRNGRISGRAFAAVVRWLYTARLAEEMWLLPDLLATCRALQLEPLVAELVAEQARLLEHQHGSSSSGGGGGAGAAQVVVVSSPEQNAEHERCFAALARTMAQPLPSAAAIPFATHPFADMTLRCGGSSGSGAEAAGAAADGHCCFAAHRVFFAQSDYFCALVHPRWGAGGDEGGGGGGGGGTAASQQFVLEGVSPACAAAILEFLYCGNVAGLGLPLVFELLGEADRLLLPLLKALCGSVLQQHADGSNVFAVLELAKMYGLLRLEEHCSVVFAACLEEAVGMPEFAALVEESARSILNREAQDSIPLVDEISDALRKAHGWEGSDSDCEDVGEDELQGGRRSGMRRLHVTREGKKKMRLLFGLVQQLGFEVLTPAGLEATGSYYDYD
jgi:hypothetical protein